MLPLQQKLKIEISEPLRFAIQNAPITEENKSQIYLCRKSCYIIRPYNSQKLRSKRIFEIFLNPNKKLMR